MYVLLYSFRGECVGIRHRIRLYGVQKKRGDFSTPCYSGYCGLFRSIRHGVFRGFRVGDTVISIIEPSIAIFANGCKGVCRYCGSVNANIQKTVKLTILTMR